MDDDIVRLGKTEFWGRREFATAWEAAGSPPLVSGGRLYDDQKELWDGWSRRLPGYNPADNPDDETQRLAHCRGVAGDLANPRRDRAACEAAGLVFPYSYEPWHMELPRVRRFAIVRSLPSLASTPVARHTTPNQIGDEMFIADLPNGSFLIVPQGNSRPKAVVLDGGSGAASSGIPRLKFETAGSIGMLNAAVAF